MFFRAAVTQLRVDRGARSREFLEKTNEGKELQDGTVLIEDVSLRIDRVTV